MLSEKRKIKLSTFKPPEEYPKPTEVSSCRIATGKFAQKFLEEASVKGKEATKSQGYHLQLSTFL